jgi:hypothetical protein
MATPEQKQIALQSDDFGHRWGILLTGNAEQLMKIVFESPHAWGEDESGHGGLEVFDQRDQTYRCYYWFGDPDRSEEALQGIVDLAKSQDVTIQLLCEDGQRAEYPVLHLSTTGKQW